MNQKHKEKIFEDELTAELQARGWSLGSPAGYDRNTGLYTQDVLDWVQNTQSKMWAKLVAVQNGQAAATLVNRLVQSVDKEGSLEVLRRGFKDVSLNFDMCQFRPAQTWNTELTAKYDKVILRVVRQVKYSVNKANDNCIDLVFFINGIPVATMELKTDFTQTVDDAITQYRDDRPPRDPQTNKDEPLLSFKRRALVHFAASTTEVHMTTKLEGKATRFLPFNQGDAGGAGNPPNPNGYKVAYLWERVFARDAFLKIFGSFVHLEKVEVEEKKNGKKTGKKVIKESMIFPRFHQLDAVNKLVDAARAEGPGHRYLVQHSAGSGKSNTIAWTAHQFASLHDAANKKVFDSVFVITDRKVLDSQLQETIYQFDHKQGVVCKIKDGDGAPPKSQQLADALKNGAPIIVCTLQTFPFAMEAIATEASAKGKSFAVIVDEAHSSQSGGAANKVKEALTANLEEVVGPERWQEILDGAEATSEEIMLAAMKGRASAKNLSQLAFTATPKAKTMELFGRLPKPSEPKAEGNLPEPFHVYSMRQAIEEGFILDVLRNYTPYKLAFKLAHNGKDYTDQEVEKSEASKKLMGWVKLHPYNISQKIKVVVEHFRANVAWRLEGKAKAMVVVGSRKEAVKWKVALDEYVKKQGYEMAALVAFSGEVSDKESGFESVTEMNAKLNPGLNGRDIRDAFDEDEFQVLIVANKFQTGFDQPKLVAMYVDKKLSGVTAVQTLSRLNRIHPGKTDTFVIDFVNDPEEVLASFKPYYAKAELAGVSDPNIIHDLQKKLDAEQIYLSTEVDNFVSVYLSKTGTQAKMQAAIAPAADRFSKRLKAALEAKPQNKLDKDKLDTFRKDVGSFIRAYDFLSQIVDYESTDLEKRAIFFKHLLPFLRLAKDDEKIDLSGVLMTHYNLKNKGQASLDLGVPKKDEEDGKLAPLTSVGGGEGRDLQKARISEIIQKMNSLFEGELTEADVLSYANHIKEKMLGSKKLEAQAAANKKDQFGESPDFKPIMIQSIASALKSHEAITKQLLDPSKPDVQTGFQELMVDLLYEAFSKKLGKGGGAQPAT